MNYIEKILKTAEEITGVSPRKWEKHDKKRFYFNYASNKNFFFSFVNANTVIGRANRPGATTELMKVFKKCQLEIVDTDGNKIVAKLIHRRNFK